MKLELKHLAPYLPYELELQILEPPFGIVPRKLELDCGHDFNYHLQEGNVKPILRPLKDVGTYIIDKEHNITFLESTGFYSESGIDFFIERVITGLVEMIIWQKLIEYHFDVFCLIEKGLAIDKNTLSH